MKTQIFMFEIFSHLDTLVSDEFDHAVVLHLQTRVSLLPGQVPVLHRITVQEQLARVQSHLSVGHLEMSPEYWFIQPRHHVLCWLRPLLLPEIGENARHVTGDTSLVTRCQHSSVHQVLDTILLQPSLELSSTCQPCLVIHLACHWSR